MHAPIKIIAFALCFPAFASACDLQPLSVIGNIAHVGSTRVNLGEADDPHHPSAWQGPLTISGAGKAACTVSDEVALVERPLLLGNGHILFVSTYSGSTNHVYAIDVHSCRIVWKGHEFNGSTSHIASVLVMGRHKQLLPVTCLP